MASLLVFRKRWLQLHWLVLRIAVAQRSAVELLLRGVGCITFVVWIGVFQRSNPVFFCFSKKDLPLRVLMSHVDIQAFNGATIGLVSFF